jgi:hypothetical protein
VGVKIIIAYFLKQDISFAMKNGVLRSEENYKKGLIRKEDVLSQDLLDLYEAGVNNSVFNRGIGYELTEMRKVNAEDFTGVKAKFDAIMGWVFRILSVLTEKLLF